MNTTKNNSECQIFFLVYVIWCRKTDMHYVGVTCRAVEKRIREHKYRKGLLIDAEIKRIGWNGNFDYWVVEERVPANLITEREQHWVAEFDSVYPNGYNRTCGGIKHFKHDKETCERIREASLGKKKAPFTDEHRANLSRAMSGENNPNYGKPRTPEVKDAIRQANLGRKHTEEEIAKMREANRGRQSPMKGKCHTEESIEKMSQAHRGNTAHKGKHHTPETRAILREKAFAQWVAKRAAQAAAQDADNQTTP